MTIQPSESVLIVDFGSQVTQLIARRVREAGVYSEIAPFSRAVEALARMRPKGIILSGGPASVTFEDSPRADPALFDAGLPVLGICYGQQLMAAQLGGRVAAGDHSEFGRAFTRSGILPAVRRPVGAGRAPPGVDEPWRQDRGDTRGFRTVARWTARPSRATADDSRRFLRVQFHPRWSTRPTAAG